MFFHIAIEKQRKIAFFYCCLLFKLNNGDDKSEFIGIMQNAKCIMHNYKIQARRASETICRRQIISHLRSKYITSVTDGYITFSAGKYITAVIYRSAINYCLPFKFIKRNNSLCEVGFSYHSVGSYSEGLCFVSIYIETEAHFINVTHNE